MGESINLEAQSRSEKNSNLLRRQGYIPGVIYGQGIAAKNLKIPAKIFEKVYSKAGESTLVNLKIDDGAPVKTLIYDVQNHALKGKILHVDFMKVNMKEKITTEIPLNFISESIVIEQMQGVLVKNMDSIEIECLPNDLVSEIEVDISVLKDFNDSIKISDIKLPNGMIPTLEPDVVVASVFPPAAEEPEEKVAEEPVADEKIDTQEAA